jgi:hypothetical protein
LPEPVGVAEAEAVFEKILVEAAGWAWRAFMVNKEELVKSLYQYTRAKVLSSEGNGKSHFRVGKTSWL